MRRAIMGIVVGVSSAVCVLGIVLLVRSFTWGEYFGISFIDEEPERYVLRHVMVHSNGGYLTLAFRRQSAENRREADELRQIIHRYNKGRAPDRLWWEKWPAIPERSLFNYRTLGFTRSEFSRSLSLVNPRGGPMDYMYSFTMPHAYVIAGSALLPVVAVWGWRRLRRRHRRGLCRGCGYDLRASTGRCPECGREIEPSAAATTSAP